jgi:hypothetical protein
MHSNSSIKKHVYITTISAIDGSSAPASYAPREVTKRLKNELRGVTAAPYESYQLCGWLRN